MVLSSFKLKKLLIKSSIPCNKTKHKIMVLSSFKLKKLLIKIIMC